MIEALRSGRADRIAQFSDLIIPDIDKKLLTLQTQLQQNKNEFDDIAEYQGHEISIRLHRMLVDMGYSSKLLVPIVTRAIQNSPEATIQSLMPTILKWLNDTESEAQPKVQNKKLKPLKAKYTSQDLWHTLDTEDLRFQFTQKNEENVFYDHLKKSTGLIFDINDWLPRVS
ncbi:MAG: hypothetical protein ACKVLO_13320 [Pseudomonadales bacterium]|tara:strand:- start:3553 stop:4065 length:513 start_codon:yes stop_codon:yes gene_type:complete